MIKDTVMLVLEIIYVLLTPSFLYTGFCLFDYGMINRVISFVILGLCMFITGAIFTFKIFNNK